MPLLLQMDGYEQLMRLGPDGIKGRVRVQFVDASGHMEAGVVGGRGHMLHGPTLHHRWDCVSSLPFCQETCLS
jgi:hypothetical protein